MLRYKNATIERFFFLFKFTLLLKEYSKNCPIRALKYQEFLSFLAVVNARNILEHCNCSFLRTKDSE